MNVCNESALKSITITRQKATQYDICAFVDLANNIVYVGSGFLSRVSTLMLTLDIDIAILSVLP